MYVRYMHFKSPDKIASVPFFVLFLMISLTAMMQFHGIDWAHFFCRFACFLFCFLKNNWTLLGEITFWNTSQWWNLFSRRALFDYYYWADIWPCLFTSFCTIIYTSRCSNQSGAVVLPPRLIQWTQWHYVTCMDVKIFANHSSANWIMQFKSRPKISAKVFARKHFPVDGLSTFVSHYSIS